MDESLKSKTAIIYDYGNNIALAERLSREFGRVNYFKPWKDTAPETLKMVAGDGLDTIHRVRDFFAPEVMDNTDLFVFPDIYDGDLQRHLISLGKRVWGSGMAEQFEYKRELFANTLKEVGLAVSPYTICIGVTALEKELKEHDDLWIKLNLRGDGETWHHENYELSKRKIEALRYQFGAVNEMVRFTVCETIATSVEAAYDGFMVTSDNGKPQFSNKGFLGYETKNLAHILHAIDYNEFPDAVREVNDKFAPKLAKYGFRSAWGTEIKIADDGKNYFLDATCRQPEPPGSIVMEQVENLGEFMYHGAAGEIRDLEIKHAFGVQVMIYSSWSKSNWQPVQIPENLRRWVKLYNYCFADGSHHVIPKSVNNTYSDGHDQIGAIVALGDSIEEAIDLVKERCNMIQGFDTENQVDALQECLRRIQEGEKEGIDFNADVPEPASVSEK